MRFKCAVCADYDLCEECNQADPHPHRAEHVEHELARIEPDTVTMAEVIAEETALLEDAQAVLGAADDEQCTYPDGYLSRQALFACLTCFEATKQASGICLACSLACHASHDIVELYTKVSLTDLFGIAHTYNSAQFPMRLWQRAAGRARVQAMP